MLSAILTGDAMNSTKVLIDIGSTFTKAVAVDVRHEVIMAAAKSPTTIETGISEGLANALRAIEDKIGSLQNTEMIACSSAAGGLRVVSVGLVPELSAEAAKRAALGAGAKIVGNYSYQLTRNEIKEIEDIHPDLLLLAGGTDGGNKTTIIHNATQLAYSHLSAPVVIAGNKSAHDAIERIFTAASIDYTFAANVMPDIGKLEVTACRNAIQEVFMQNIVKAKGLDEAKDLVGNIIMPTPVAVLNAAVLLATGTNGEKGLGELIIVDVGGATTDVYSIASGTPAGGARYMRGLPEPFAKRTVEGDLGVRHNIATLMEICATKGIALDADVVAAFASMPSKVSANDREQAVDAELARMCVAVSIERHVGKVDIVYGPHGEMHLQTGKDLTQVCRVIGTGGPIVHAAHPELILGEIPGGTQKNNLLKPVNADLYLDEKYLLFAIGLLARSEPQAALRISKKYLRKL
jgi:uncharacterized protein (TIGR01319 family)